MSNTHNNNVISPNGNDIQVHSITQGNKYDFIGGDAFTPIWTWVKQQPYYGLIVWISLMIVRFLALYSLILTRHKLGKRTYSFITIGIAGFLFILVGGIAGSAENISSIASGNGGGAPNITYLQMLFLLLFFGLSIFHKIQNWWMDVNGQKWYGYSLGIANIDFLVERVLNPIVTNILSTINHPTLKKIILYYFPNYRLPEYFINAYLQPIFVGVFGLIFLFIDIAIGFTLIYSSLCCSFLFRTMRNTEQNRIDDMIDKDIISSIYDDALNNAPTSQTRGYSLNNVVRTQEDREMLQRSFVTTAD